MISQMSRYIPKVVLESAKKFCHTFIMSGRISLFNKSKITFSSGGVNCVGYLYLPNTNNTKVPCVVMANGFSGTMDWNLPNYAEKFVAIGIAVLIFDYRYFGESQGEPRQLININKQ